MRLVTWRVNLPGSRTWAGMKLIFDDLFLLLDLKSNLIRIGNPVRLMLVKPFYWPFFTSHLLKMVTARACLKFVLIEVLPENHLIGYILLATA